MSYDKDRNKSYPTRTFKKRASDDNQYPPRYPDYNRDRDRDDRGEPRGRDDREYHNRYNDRPDRNDRPERYDRPDRNDRPERHDRPDRYDRQDRNDYRGSHDRNDYRGPQDRDRDRDRNSHDDNEYRWNREGANLNNAAGSGYPNQQRYYKQQRPYSPRPYQQNNNYGGGGAPRPYQQQQPYGRHQGHQGGHQGHQGHQGGGHYQPHNTPYQRPYDGGGSGKNNPYVRRQPPRDNRDNPRENYGQRPDFIKRKPQPPMMMKPKKAPARFAKKMPASPRHFASLPRALRAHQFASRQIAIDFIKNARVLVNNAVLSDPNARINVKRDRLMVDAMPLAPSRPIYVIMNKPKGLIPSKENNVESIHSLIPHSEHWHFPVGRLHKAATGVVILTNDPAQNNYMDSPFKNIEKEYHVKVQRIPKKTEITAITKAIRALHSDEFQKSVRVEIYQKNVRSCWLSITVFEGKSSEICSILKENKLEVLAFHRFRVGSVTSNLVSPGAWKQMNELEIAMLTNSDTSEASFLYKKLDRIPGKEGEENDEDTQNEQDDDDEADA